MPVNSKKNGKRKCETKKQKAKQMTEHELKAEVDEMGKTPIKRTNKSDNKKADNSNINNNNDYNPLKASILQILKKDLVKHTEKVSNSSEKEVWSTPKETLLQHHLEAFHSLMEVQPKRHTEAQIKMERQRVHEAAAEKQTKELQRLRLASINATPDVDTAVRKQEFLKKQQEKERNRNQEEMDKLQHVGMNKKSKSTIKDKSLQGQIPVVAQASSQKMSKKTWRPVQTGFTLNSSDDVVWPQVKPSRGNVWSEQERKQQQLESLIPKTSGEEDDMMLKAVELSKKTAEEELEFRRFYPPDDDEMANFLVSRLTMESQQLTEWIESPNKPTYRSKQSNLKSPPKNVSPPIEPLSKWNYWSKLETQTKIKCKNPKEKHAIQQQQKSSPSKTKSPSNVKIKTEEEPSEIWSEEDITDSRSLNHHGYDTHQDILDTDKTSENCGTAVGKALNSDQQYYDPYGGARSKYQNSYNPPILAKSTEIIKPVWVSHGSHQQKPQFSTRCKVIPEFETLFCKAFEDVNQNESINEPVSLKIKPSQTKVKVVPQTLEFEYSSDIVEDWNEDVDYIGPECDPQMKKVHLSYSGYPAAYKSPQIVVATSKESVQIPQKQVMEVTTHNNYSCENKDVNAKFKVLQLPESNYSSLKTKDPTVQSKGIRLMSARSQFTAAKAQFLLSRISSNNSLNSIDTSKTHNLLPALPKGLSSDSYSSNSKPDTNICPNKSIQTRMSDIRNECLSNMPVKYNNCISNYIGYGVSVSNPEGIHHANPLHTAATEADLLHTAATEFDLLHTTAAIEADPQHTADTEADPLNTADTEADPLNTTAAEALPLHSTATETDPLHTAAVEANPWHTTCTEACMHKTNINSLSIDSHQTISGCEEPFTSDLTKIDRGMIYKHNGYSSVDFEASDSNLQKIPVAVKAPTLLPSHPVVQDAPIDQPAAKESLSYPNVSDLPQGLPPHLVNAYLLFLQQQSESNSTLMTSYQPSLNTRLDSRPTSETSSNLLTTCKRNPDLIALHSTIRSEDINTCQNASFQHSYQMSKENLKYGSAHSKDNVTNVANFQTSSLSVPTSHLSRVNYLHQSTNEHFINGDSPFVAIETQNVIGHKPMYSDQNNNYKAMPASLIIDNNECTQLVNSLNSMCSIESNDVPNHLKNQQVPSQRMELIVHNSESNPSVPCMKANPVIHITNLCKLNMAPRLLPLLYPTFSPYRNSLPSAMPKAYNYEVFTHSVQQKLQQQPKNQQNSETMIQNALTKSSSCEAMHICNKERSKRKLECLNKVKSLIEEVRKDGRNIKVCVKDPQ